MSDWNLWIAQRIHLAAKLKCADRTNIEAYFLKIHAASEAFFRRLLFVGLRLNMVSFHDAQEWLHHNDSTPTKSEFPKTFNRLYGPDLSFEMLLAKDPRSQILWELWFDFAKPVRNHLAHGIRGYTSDWLECGIRINQGLLIELDAGMAEYLGGSIADNLSKLRPRLPTGKKGINISTLLGQRRGRPPKPSISLVDARNRLIEAGLL